MAAPKLLIERLTGAQKGSIGGQSLLDPYRADKLLRRFSWQDAAGPPAHPNLRLQRKA